jgi:hypothetical protein
MGETMFCTPDEVNGDGMKALWHFGTFIIFYNNIFISPRWG